MQAAPHINAVQSVIASSGAGCQGVISTAFAPSPFGPSTAAAPSSSAPSSSDWDCGPLHVGTNPLPRCVLEIRNLYAKPSDAQGVSLQISLAIPPLGASAIPRSCVIAVSGLRGDSRTSAEDAVKASEVVIKEWFLDAEFLRTVGGPLVTALPLSTVLNVAAIVAGTSGDAAVSAPIGGLSGVVRAFLSLTFKPLVNSRSNTASLRFSQVGVRFVVEGRRSQSVESVSVCVSPGCDDRDGAAPSTGRGPSASRPPAASATRPVHNDQYYGAGSDCRSPPAVPLRELGRRDERSPPAWPPPQLASSSWHGDHRRGGDDGDVVVVMDEHDDGTAGAGGPWQPVYPSQQQHAPQHAARHDQLEESVVHMYSPPLAREPTQQSSTAAPRSQINAAANWPSIVGTKGGAESARNDNALPVVYCFRDGAWHPTTDESQQRKDAPPSRSNGNQRMPSPSTARQHRHGDEDVADDSSPRVLENTAATNGDDHGLQHGRHGATTPTTATRRHGGSQSMSPYLSHTADRYGTAVDSGVPDFSPVFPTHVRGAPTPVKGRVVPVTRNEAPLGGSFSVDPSAKGSSSLHAAAPVATLASNPIVEVVMDMTPPVKQQQRPFEFAGEESSRQRSAATAVAYHHQAGRLDYYAIPSSSADAADVVAARPHQWQRMTERGGAPKSIGDGVTAERGDPSRDNHHYRHGLMAESAPPAMDVDTSLLAVPAAPLAPPHGEPSVTGVVNNPTATRPRDHDGAQTQPPLFPYTRDIPPPRPRNTVAPPSTTGPSPRHEATEPQQPRFRTRAVVEQQPTPMATPWDGSVITDIDDDAVSISGRPQDSHDGIVGDWQPGASFRREDHVVAHPTVPQTTTMPSASAVAAYDHPTMMMHSLPEAARQAHQRRHRHIATPPLPPSIAASGGRRGEATNSNSSVGSRHFATSAPPSPLAVASNAGTTAGEVGAAPLSLTALASTATVPRASTSVPSARAISSTVPCASLSDFVPVKSLRSNVTMGGGLSAAAPLRATWAPVVEPPPRRPLPTKPPASAERAPSVPTSAAASRSSTPLQSVVDGDTLDRIPAIDVGHMLLSSIRDVLPDVPMAADWSRPTSRAASASRPASRSTSAHERPPPAPSTATVKRSGPTNGPDAAVATNAPIKTCDQGVVRSRARSDDGFGVDAPRSAADNAPLARRGAAEVPQGATTSVPSKRFAVPRTAPSPSPEQPPHHPSVPLKVDQPPPPAAAASTASRSASHNSAFGAVTMTAVPSSKRTTTLAERDMNQYRADSAPCEPSPNVADSRASSHRDAASGVAQWSRVVAWCLKHHFSRDSVGRRLLHLERPGGVASTALTLSLSKSDGTSWKGAPGLSGTPSTSTAPSAGARASCSLQKGRVLLLTGVDAMHDAAVHQGHVREPSRVFVLRENSVDRNLIIAVEVIDDADYRQLIDLLRTVV